MTSATTDDYSSGLPSKDTERPRVSSQTVLVLTTCGSVKEAENLAKTLVERRLAACVNTVPDIMSTYRWQDAVQHERETLLMIKTTEACLKSVEQTIKERSSYELPEVVAIPVQGGSVEYIDWLHGAVTKVRNSDL
jgi:periplasmic divalent cation tolerance protein